MNDLVYILSPSYSGSTLLTFLLGSHPCISTVGELKATARGDIDIYKCSCGAVISKCGFWKTLTDELARRDVSFSIEDFRTHFALGHRPLANRLLRSAYRGGWFESARRLGLSIFPKCHRELQDILHRNQSVIEAVIAIQGGDIFLDGSKDAVRLKLLIDSRLWNVKVIQLIRNGRGSTSSYMRIHKLSFRAACWQWRRSQEECDRLIADLPDQQCLPVRYEDLCLDPTSTLDRIFEFLGIDPSLVSLNYLSVEHHILGHAMRLRDNGQISLNEKWKLTWPPSQYTAFQRIAGLVNQRHGYA